MFVNSAALESSDRTPRSDWLFSRRVDLVTFLGSALLALGLLVVGHFAGWLNGETPEFLWVTAILMIDVAHVYATGFRVYFDPAELRQRPWLYGLVPLLAFGIGAAVYSESSTWFWRLLAYLAVFHFVRQQAGWVALYRARGRESSRIGLWIDRAAISAATLYPLIYWHAHLPRRFWWFLAGDFAHLPAIVESIARPLYWAAVGLYVSRMIWLAFRGEFHPGKDIVVVTTAICWYVGIVTFNSDYAFTVTNVIIHGVPYLVLVYWYRWERSPETHRAPRAHSRVHSLVVFLGAIWLLAYCEELLWDAGVWHDRTWLFGSWSLDGWSAILVPLLAVPQLTHYILDGFIWRRRSNRKFAEMVDSPGSNDE